jgi:hypothetical protein
MRFPVVSMCAILLAAAGAHSEAPTAANTGPIARYSATSANVSGAPDAIRIDILRWSTDAERDRLVDAWNLKTANTGRGGRGVGGRGGRGGAARGGSGRGAARGGADGDGGGGEATVAGPAPEAMLANALKEARTVGYLWSSEVAGYAIRYAGRVANADGSERIVLITQRRLGAVNDLWKPVGAEASAYDFSVIELRVGKNGAGEGKTSLSGKVAPDDSLRIVALADYDALPVGFSHIQRRGESQR